MDSLTQALGIALLAAAASGSVYVLVAAALVSTLRERDGVTRGPCPGVTIMKPLHGAEPGLRENLATFFEQRYAGPVQMLLGVADEGDGAVPIARALMTSRPDVDATLIVGHGMAGANRKISTLVALEPHARHDVIVLSDSDIAVPVDYLTCVTAALAAKGVCLVTCLYRGQPQGGLWARLASMAIDHHFLPGVIVGVRLGLARPCFGSTIALSRDTLGAIGGFRAFADHLADDYAIGRAVRATGHAVAIPRLVIVHACPETSLRDLLQHELRWACTIRSVEPAAHAASVIAHPVALALLAAALLPAQAVTATVVALALVARIVLALRVDHTLGVPGTRAWLAPARDVLSFVVFVASFFVRSITWRGRRYRVRADGTLSPIGGPSR
ncbi:MAG TPA: bacteriohopanetetrol glucosamine biosynthesis glycosyltransferase HpnI [Casimicrobiaceae bacterium]|jgi:ceramide glucosyltransferase